MDVDHSGFYLVSIGRTPANPQDLGTPARSIIQLPLVQISHLAGRSHLIIHQEFHQESLIKNKTIYLKKDEEILDLLRKDDTLSTVISLTRDKSRVQLLHYLHSPMSIQSSIQRSIQSRSQLIAYSTIFSALLWGAPLVQAQEISTRYRYPEPIVEGFITQCSQEPSDLPAPVKRRLCGCLVTEFQNQYTFETFQAIGKQVQAGQPMPREMAAVITQCVEKIMLKQALQFPETRFPETTIAKL